MPRQSNKLSKNKTRMGHQTHSRRMGLFDVGSIGEVPTKMTAIELLRKVPFDTETDKLYDAIRKVEQDYGLKKHTLIDIIRQGQKGRWDKAPVDTSADNGSFHMWLEDEDGTIIDPHFEEYDGMMKMSNCYSKRKVYSKWTEEQQKEKLTNLIPSIVKVIKDNCETNRMDTKAMTTILALNPQFRCCPMNAWCLKSLKPSLKVCIGNMGFVSRDDEDKIWWEY